MNAQNNSVSDSEQISLERLRAILLQDDRQAIEELREILNTHEKLSERVNPIVQEHIELLKKNFPKEFKIVVNKLIEQKIRDSQPELLDILYPSIGKMIVKFVGFQMELLKESITEQIKFMASPKGLLRTLKNKILGINEVDLILSNASGSPVLEEIFVIQRDTGLLVGNATLRQTVDRDTVAGMLTAIKGFVEDAFARKQEELEVIRYDTYLISLQNFPTFYFALALSGTVGSADLQNFRERINQFVLDTAELRNKQLEENVILSISEKLNIQFIEPQKERLKEIEAQEALAAQMALDN